MKWIIKDKEYVVKTCFAILPKRIGSYMIWFSRYYKTYDFVHQGVYSCYVPHWFVNKEDAIEYIKNKATDKGRIIV